MVIFKKRKAKNISQTAVLMLIFLHVYLIFIIFTSTIDEWMSYTLRQWLCSQKYIYIMRSAYVQYPFSSHAHRHAVSSLRSLTKLIRWGRSSINGNAEEPELQDLSNISLKCFSCIDKWSKKLATTVSGRKMGKFIM